MTTRFAAQTFDTWTDNDSCRTFADIEFRECVFAGCSLSMTYNPQRRSIVKNVVLHDCSARGCFVGPAIIEKSIVDGLQVAKVLMTTGTAFKHVKLKGLIGRLIIGQVIPRPQ